MIEAGVDPEEFFNVLRLTPSVYHHPDHGWATRIEPCHCAAANEDNARYCLDVVVTILTNLAAQDERIRHRPSSGWKATLLRDEPLRARASADSPLAGRTLPTDAAYVATAVVDGLDGTGPYVRLLSESRTSQIWLGFVPKDACRIEEP